MQLTYNKFKQVVDRSSQKVFDKIAEAFSASDNAALVAMYDDKLIVLDEANEDLYLCDYTFENGVLGLLNFEEIGLTENDDSYLDEVVEKYFDLDDDEPISLSQLKTGFDLKFKNESKSIFMEAKDLKARKIMESPRIRALKGVRRVRDLFAEDIQNLMEEPFMQHLDQKLYNPNIASQETVGRDLNKVTFKHPYPIFVNTEQGKETKELIKLKDDTNAMDAMKNLAGHLSDKWKSDSFRKKFERMINQIIQTESIELGKNAVLNFLDENKELFLLKDNLFEELITKTTLMLGEGDTDSIVAIFKKIFESKEGRLMRTLFFRENGINEEKLERINTIVEAGEDDMEGDDLEAAPVDKDVSNDLDSEEVNKILDIFKKIKKQLEADSPESEYVNGLIAALDSAKVKGIEDSKMKEIIDFLSSANAPEKEEKGSKKKKEEEPEEEMDI